MIGCWTALKRGLVTDVVYFFDLTGERVTEALASSKKYGFKPWFAEPYGDTAFVPAELSVKIRSIDTILCPTVRDSHDQHAKVSVLARSYQCKTNCNLLFYTVDMNSFQVPLPEDQRLEKKKDLLELFPSQANLLQDEKYHLFEGYAETDHMVRKKYLFGSTVVTMKGYNPPETIPPMEDDEHDERYLNRLVVNYYNRSMVTEITVETPTHTVEFNG